MDRFHTHIVMVSGQPTPNVLPVMDKSIRPEEVILCTTDDMRRNGEILADYFKRHQIRSRIYELGSAYDFAALQEKFLNLALEFSGRASETGVNLTGGTKLMTIAAQQVFWEDFPCFYINPERNTIQCITEDGAPEYPIAGQLKISDFFAIHGYRVVSSKRREATAKTELLCRTLFGECSRYSDSLRTLNYLAGEAEKTLFARNDVPEKSWELLQLFQDQGAIRYYDDKKIKFADEDGRRFCRGFWLEDWVGSELRELNRRVKLQDYASSIVIGSGSNTSNEIDAAFLYNNRLYLIECKTAGLDEDAKSAPPLYKLDSLHLRPGIFTGMILASYQPLDSCGRRRAADLRVRVVEMGNLLGLATCLEKMICPEGH